MHKREGCVNSFVHFYLIGVPMDIEKFVERLKELRGERTQADFAQLTGISLRALANYEQGERLPKVDVVAAICARMGASADWLLFGDDLRHVAGKTPAQPVEALPQNQRQAIGRTPVRATQPAESPPHNLRHVAGLEAIHALQTDLIAQGRELATALRDNAAMAKELAEVRVRIAELTGEKRQLEQELDEYRTGATRLIAIKNTDTDDTVAAREQAATYTRVKGIIPIQENNGEYKR